MESPTTILTHGLTAVLSNHTWAGFSVFCHVMNWWQEGLKEQSRTMLTGEKGLDTIPLPWESLSFCWSNLMRYNPLSFRTVKLQSFYSGSTFSGRNFEYRSRQGNDSYHLSVMFIFAIFSVIVFEPFIRVRCGEGLDWENNHRNLGILLRKNLKKYITFF